MLITHAYRKAKCEPIAVDGNQVLVSHSIKFEKFQSWNCVECFWGNHGIDYKVTAFTNSDMIALSLTVPPKVYPWLKGHLFPESITLGAKLAKSLRNQAKVIQEYCEAPHIIYGVARDPNGQLRTFFKPCSDKELELHERNTDSYIYAIH